MFVRHALVGDFTVVTLLLTGQFLLFAAFDRVLGIGMDFLDSDVARVNFDLDAPQRANAGSLVQLEIMRFSMGERSANDDAGYLVYDDLRLSRVTFFLAGVVAPLSFFGRSMGLSVTSTSTVSYFVSGRKSAFFPGSAKEPLFISTFSTHFTVRCTLLSSSPKLAPMCANDRYSRQYSNTIKSLSSMSILGFRPRRLCFSACAACKSSSIFANVSRFTPVIRRKSSSLYTLIVSHFIRFFLLF